MVFWTSKSGISSKYSLSSSPTFAAEPWSVYTGRPKSSSSNSASNSKVSVFIFDKKQYEHYLLTYGIIRSKSSSSDKQLLQEGYEILRNQVSNLAKLKHPNILTLVEPLEEHSKNFMFVTEYVTGSLETFFKGEEEDEEDFLQGHIKNDIVIQRGILQMITGLDFIHNIAKSVHLDIQPKSVFINGNSDWKISGLGHLVKLPEGSDTKEYLFSQYDPRTPAFMMLNLDFAAPEIVFENLLTCKNDYFSLGLLINFLYNGQNVALKTENSISQYKSEYTSFERKVNSRSWDSVFLKVPPKLRPCIPKLMNRDLYARYDNITDILESDFFNDPLVKTLNFLDELPAKSNEERLVFLDGLAELLPQFPTALLQRKFLPILADLLELLCQDKTPDARCISKDLNILIKIGRTLSQLTFQERLYPLITNKKNFIILLETSALTLIENLPVLKEKVKNSNFIEHILSPLLKYVFEGCTDENVIVLQEQLLGQISLILESYDFPAIKNFIVPLLSKLFTKTTSLTVKISCVSCFTKMVEQKAIDAYICAEEILPIFKTMKTRDARILFKALQLFERVPQLITDEVVLVESLLPLLWSYSMSSTLNKAQYSQFVNVINTLSTDIQKKHTSRLNEGSLEPGDTPNAFKKIIEGQPTAKKVDPENEASKNVSIPVIQPIKKTTPSGNGNGNGSSILTPQDKRTTSSPMTQRRGAVNSPSASYNSVGRGGANGNTSPNVSARRLQSPPMAQSRTVPQNDGDTFSKFMASSPSAASLAPRGQQTAPSNATSKTKLDVHSPMSPSKQQTGSTLPPGFSISLQPSRKDSTPNSSSNNSISNGALDSLI
ncbi:Scy1p KNAG_0F02100 [Huiozyma naganishii CBS 8797]|uniref:Protein kinase domain-containing protein n=1 Tax=Huiozyma naganishii (strain ATCC MYA-139 / BCRC 22969 / CBS 8797 / KCTC 17520 / NBRC 10181 / NCYC 3082 / Yp74L-3) TaxID=1071383 RepID=J7S035_HUIN7|nr:hypothetical protein KNAG_0F02100 [Kazachstania naganishii CBS 8797]CCK70877.1 hypothetical protein KNAG_0F02100 [Kazachstania naganishii CBS 8797]